MKVTRNYELPKNRFSTWQAPPEKTDWKKRMLFLGKAARQAVTFTLKSCTYY